MTIRSKLWLSALTSVGLVVLVGIVLVLDLRAINRANDKGSRVVEINEAITEMRFVTFESLRHNNERTLEQWYLKYDDISRLLVPLPSHTREEQFILTDMSEQHRVIRALFDRLVVSLSEQKGEQPKVIQQAFRERLVTQLMLKQQIKISGAVKLTNINREEIRDQQTRSARLVLIVITLMLLITVINAFHTITTITRSLSQLQRGAEEITRGKLSYRIRLKEHNEFSRLAQGFNTMAKSVEELDKLKTQFVTIAAHQLRTPISVLRWQIEELLDKKVAKNAQTREQRMRAMQKAILQITARVDDLLTAIHIEQRRIELSKEESRLDDLLSDTVTEMHDDFATKGVKLAVASPTRSLPFVHIDPRKLKSVFRQLLANALAYTPAGGEVNARLYRRGQKIYFAVTDTGIGIPVEDQAHIFQRFVRGSNASTAMPDASGLGLFIAKHLIEAHSGTMGFTSKEGKGSTFWFELPTTSTS